MGDVAIVIELGEEQPVEAHTLEPQRKTNFYDVGGDCTLCTRRFIIKTYKEVTEIHEVSFMGILVSSLLQVGIRKK